MEDMVKETLGQLVKQAVPRIPGWALLTALAVFIGIVVWKATKADQAEFLWGMIKTNRNEELRVLLRQQQELSQVLEGVVPLVTFLNAELADLLDNLEADAGLVASRSTKIYDAILAAAAQITGTKGYHRVAILFPESDGNKAKLGLAYSLRFSTSAVKGLKFDAEHSIPGRVYQTGDLYYCEDVSKDKNYIRNPKSTHEYRSFVCLPIKSRRTVFGVLQIDAVPQSAFSNDDIQRLSALAKYAAVLRGVERMVQIEEVEVAASEEPIRGVN